MAYFLCKVFLTVERRADFGGIERGWGSWAVRSVLLLYQILFATKQKLCGFLALVFCAPCIYVSVPSQSGVLSLSLKALTFVFSRSSCNNTSRLFLIVFSSSMDMTLISVRFLHVLVSPRFTEKPEN